MQPTPHIQRYPRLTYINSLSFGSGVMFVGINGRLNGQQSELQSNIEENIQYFYGKNTKKGQQHNANMLRDIMIY